MFSSSDTYHIVPISNAGDSNSTESVEMDWSYGLAGLFSQPITRKSKKQAPGFIPAIFKENLKENKEGNTRIDENVDFVTLLVLDIDDPQSLGKVKSIFSNIEYFLFPTWSRLEKGEEKYRLVAPLAEPIPGEMWKETANKVILATGADEMCSNPSRFYFLPATPENPKVEYQLIHNRGEKVDVNFFDQVAESYLNERKASNDIEAIKKFKIKTSNERPKEEVRHFTGSVVGKKKNASPIIDYSYQGMLVRHMDFIEQYLKTGQNHKFVRELTMREIGRHGEKTHVESLVKFLYRVYEDFPNKHYGLAGRPGDTENDIEKLILGAAHRSGIEFSKVHHSFTEQFTEHAIDRYKAHSRVKALTHRQLKAQGKDVEDLWEFPGILDRRIKYTKRTIEQAFDDLKSRYSSEIRQYMRSENWRLFATTIIRKEVPIKRISSLLKEVNSDNFDSKENKEELKEELMQNMRALWETTRFITHSTDMLFEKHFQRKINGKNFELACDRMAKMISDGDKELERKIAFGFAEGVLSMKSLDLSNHPSLQPA